MRGLDTRAQELMKNIDLLADEYLRNNKCPVNEEKKDKLDKIQGLFNKAKVIVYKLLQSYSKQRKTTVDGSTKHTY